jgi:predicted nucleic acid-binding protein
LSDDRSPTVVYLDSSAIVKLVVAERESAALRRYLRARPQRVSCGLARVEVMRAVQPHGGAAIARARRLLRRLDLVQLDDELLDAAAALDAGILRSLDAIHLAAAQLLADDLTAVVTYDARMTAAAGRLGVPVAAPR